MSTEVFVAQQYIRVRRSGATGNNLGSVMYTDEIPESDLQNLFPDLTESEAKNGVIDYAAVYFLNEHPTRTAKGLVLFSPNTASSSTFIRFAVDPQGVGDGVTFGIGQQIPNKLTAPTAVSWKDGTTRAHENALILPDLPPNRAIMIWFERNVEMGAQSMEDDNMPVIIDTNNIQGDTGIAELADTASYIVTGLTAINIETDELNRVINTEKPFRKYIFLGNSTYEDDVRPWITNLGKHYIKDLVKFTYGWRDVRSTTKRNQIINGVDPKSSSGYQYYIDRNVAFIFMDTSGYQNYKNPSTHYNRIISYLDNANRNPNVDFIIVVMGTAMYASLPENMSDATPIDTDARKYYHSQFTKYGVHLVIGCGYSNYQRQHVLGYNPATPDSPTMYFTTEGTTGKGVYTIAAKQKNFGNTGPLFIVAGSAARREKHNFFTPKTYTAFGHMPLGVGYLKIFTSRRVEGSPPILEGRYYDYYVPQATQSTNQPLRRVKKLIDTFKIKFSD